MFVSSITEDMCIILFLSISKTPGNLLSLLTSFLALSELANLSVPKFSQM